MSRLLTSAIIATGMLASLLGWGVAKTGHVALHALRPGPIAAQGAPLPRFSVQLSIEVQP